MMAVDWREGTRASTSCTSALRDAGGYTEGPARVSGAARKERRTVDAGELKELVDEESAVALLPGCTDSEGPLIRPGPLALLAEPLHRNSAERKLERAMIRCHPPPSCAPSPECSSEVHPPCACCPD